MPELEKHAFRMKLFAGKEVEYKKRHDEIWPELVALLHEAGVSDYSIHLDPETSILFGVLTRPKVHGMAALPEHPVMKNGGRIWLISWRAIPTIRPSQKTW